MSNRYLCGAAKLLQFYSGQFDLDHATDTELRTLAESGTHAADSARDLASLIDKIGRLVASDMEQEKEGSFGAEDVPSLLWTIAEQVDVLGQMTSIGCDAAYTLGQRAAQPAGEPPSRRKSANAPQIS